MKAGENVAPVLYWYEACWWGILTRAQTSYSEIICNKKSASRMSPCHDAYFLARASSKARATSWNRDKVNVGGLAKPRASVTSIHQARDKCAASGKCLGEMSLIVWSTRPRYVQNHKEAAMTMMLCRQNAWWPVGNSVSLMLWLMSVSARCVTVRKSGKWKSAKIMP